MSIPKEIVNRVGGQVELDISEIHNLQGELKSLHVNEFNKLKKSILEEGLIDPPNVWFDPNKKRWAVVGGHQRLFVLKALHMEGYHIGKIKCTAILADSHTKALEYVLLMSSTYGKMTDASVSDYFMDHNLDFERLSGVLDLPNVSLDLETEDDLKRNASREEKALAAEKSAAETREKIAAMEKKAAVEAESEGQEEDPFEIEMRHEDEDLVRLTVSCPECGHNFDPEQECHANVTHLDKMEAEESEDDDEHTE